jgi:Domain of unknown function (DUF4265)
MAGEFIKIHVTYDGQNPAGEWLWAVRISPTTAKVDNIPFFTTAFTLGDLVKIDRRHEVVRVLERGARTRHATYPKKGSEAAVRKRYTRIKEYLKRYDVEVEGAFPGLLAMAVPLDVSDEELHTICLACPVSLEVLEP